jgi:dienelactone hydrolase
MRPQPRSRIVGVLIAAVALTLSAVACARREIETREIQYTQDGTNLKGFVAWNAAARGTRPGVLVVHEWWGHNEHARRAARRLAEAGYVGFALDMYGDGKMTTHPDTAGAWMSRASQDPAVLTARFNAALEQLKQDPHVDPDRIAAIGYCFGGAVALRMARSGADLDAVVTFHPVLDTTRAVAPGAVQGRVLMLTGEADPFVPPEVLTAFTTQMRAAGTRFEVVSYPGAKHAFTNPDAGKAGLPALVYDAEADRQSWAAMLRLLGEVWR